MILSLFISFLKIGLMSIGGGYAAMPLIEAETVVKNGWLSMQEFADLVTIAEMTPGPIGINAATFVGVCIAGLWGALVASLGFLLPSMVIVSLLFFLYRRYKSFPLLKNVLGTLRPVVAALILSAGLKLLMQAFFQGKGLSAAHLDIAAVILFSGAFFALRASKWNPILILLLCGAAGLLIGLLGGYA